MVDLEQKLRAYSEYNPAQISEEFLQRLKALEPRPAAARKPRRYVLPVAAALAVALGLTGWAILRAARSDGPQTAPPAVTLEEPSAQIPDSPAIPSSTAPPEKKDPASPAPKAENEPIPEAPVSLTKPGQSGAVFPESGSTPSAKPDAAPAKPEDPTPVKPEDPTPAKPNGPTTVKPDNPNPPVDPPADDPPVDPPDDSPDDPPDNPPVNDPPAVVKLESPFSAEFHSEGERDIVTLTLLSTGEHVEIDVTGWEASSGHAVSAGEHPDDPQTPQNGTTDSWVWLAVAFHQPVYIQFTVDGDGTVHAEAYYLSDYINHITQSIPGKENEDET